MMRSDYKVEFRREDTLADAALTWRREARNENLSYFNVVEFVTGVLSNRTRRPFTIEFFDAKAGEKPAYVSFKPRILHIDREIWHLANLGEPEARFIVAHEVCHLLHHDHFATAFSDDPSERIKFAEQEYSAEWQANVFAFYFLMPDLIVAAYRSIDELSTKCGVTRDIAEQRVAMSSRLSLLYSSYNSGICATCGDFTTNGSCTNTACGPNV